MYLLISTVSNDCQKWLCKCDLYACNWLKILSRQFLNWWQTKRKSISLFLPLEQVTGNWWEFWLVFWLFVPIVIGQIKYFWYWLVNIHLKNALLSDLWIPLGIKTFNFCICYWILHHLQLIIIYYEHTEWNNRTHWME